MRTSLLLIFTFISFSVLAINVDSLKQVLSQDLLDTDRFYIYEELHWHHVHSDPPVAKAYADSCYQLAIRLKSKEHIAQSLLSYGNAYLINNQPDSALLLYDEGLAIAKYLKIVPLINRLNGARTSAFNLMGKYEEAKLLSEEVLREQIGKKDTSAIITVLSNLGNLKLKMGLPEAAISHLLQALEYAQSPEHFERKGIAQMNIGVIYATHKDNENAILHFLEAEKILEDGNDKMGLITIYNNLGELYFQDGKNKRSEEYFRKALAINEFHIPGLAFSNLGLSKIYNTNQQQELALKHAQAALRYDQQVENQLKIPVDHGQIGKILSDMGRYEESLEQYAIAEKLSQDLPMSINIIEFKRNILSTSLTKDNLLQYKDQLSDYFALKDSFDILSKQEAIKEIETKYETEKKEAENKLLQKEKKLQQFTINQQRNSLLGAISVVGLLSLISFLLYRQSKERKANNLLLSRQKKNIETLHRELSHRVSNNLAFITSLQRMQRRKLENTEAKEAITESENRIHAMSSIHKRLSQNERGLVDLSDYLGELCLHLRRTYARGFDHDLITIDTNQIKTSPEIAMRVGLIVNELVTNSFKYAFDNTEHPSIKVLLKNKSGKEYLLRYEDNGSGIPDFMGAQKKKTIGLNLIDDLVLQMDGKVEVQVNSGVCYQINFKDEQLQLV